MSITKYNVHHILWETMNETIKLQSKIIHSKIILLQWFWFYPIV